MSQQQEENGQDGLEAQVREWLGQIARIHQQGGSVFSRAALHGLYRDFADAPPDSPLPGWIAETAAALGLAEADWQQLPGADGAFLGELFDQSRQVLGAGVPALAQIGFAVGELLARAHEDAMPVLGWLALGRMTCLLEMGAGAGEAAVAIGRQALGLTVAVDESPGGLDAAGAARLQQLWQIANALKSAGRYTEAEPLWAQVQATVDALPDSEAVRNDRASARMNRASNLMSLGAHTQAEALFAEAQERFEQLPDSEAVRHESARVRMGRANNLLNIGAHTQAEALFAEAQERFEQLSDSDAVRMNHAIVRMNRANNLACLGAHAEAETLFAEAQERFEQLSDSDAVQMNHALVRIGRADNLASLGAHAEAETLFAEAQKRFEQLSDSDAVQMNHALVRIGRADNLASLGAHAEAETLFAEAQERFEQMPDSNTVRHERARVCMNRASNLDSLGAHREAEAHYAIAQALFDDLPDSETVRSDRVRVRMRSASNLNSLGAHREAEALYVIVQALFDDLPDSKAVRNDRALVRMNRANNLRNLGAHREAEAHYAAAQALFDDLPDSEVVRNDRALLRMNRANNLGNLGAHLEAEAHHAAAQDMFDALPDSEAVRSDRALVRMNRANNLGKLGDHHEAEAHHAAAQALFDDLPDSEAVRRDRARVRMFRASNLRVLGDHREAEAHHAAAQALFDALPDSEAVRSDRALVRTNRANNLHGLGAYSEAEAHYAAAQALFDALLDSQAVRTSRAVVRLNRLSNRESMYDWPESSRPLWDSLWTLLDQVRLQSTSDVAKLLRLAGWCLTALQAQGVVEAGTCARQLRTLCTWALDWLDLVVDPASQDPSVAWLGGLWVASLLATAESWFAAQGQYATVVALLAAYHSRYASAHRLQTALAAAGDEVDDVAEGAADPEFEARAIAQMRREYQALAHALQALESRPAELRDAAFATEHQHLLAERERQADALRERLRAFRIDAGFDTEQDEAFSAARLQPKLAADGEACRALVILLRVETASPTADDPEATVARALALVLGPAAPDWQQVELPDALLAAVPVATLQPTKDGNLAWFTPQPDGRTLIEAVRDTWARIEPHLGEAHEVHLGVHHTLGELPWSSAADRDLPPAGVPLAGFDCLRRRLCVHLGVSLAVQALGRGPERLVAAPGAGRRLGVLAHSPAANDAPGSKPVAGANRGSQDPTRRSSDPIPGVHADLAITRQNVPHHRVLADAAAVLASTEPLLQLSCHGEPRSAHTGAGERWLGTYELLSHRRTPPEAVLLFACSTALAGVNAWGEAGGWGAVLGDRVRLCLGALYPVSDPWMPFYTLLLHRAWTRRQDLKAAMAEVRARLRSGRWGDSETEIDKIVEQYAQAMAHMPAPGPGQGSPAEILREFGCNAEARSDAYLQEPDMRRMTEAFVVYG